MKKSIITIVIVSILSCFSAQSQSELNVGLGYFGANFTYKGFLCELEYEKFHADRFSTPFKLDFGFYRHPRSHNALFLDVHEGFRRYSKNSKWYFEQSIGFGIMLSFYNEEVWHIDENGTAALTSNVANLDYMPSVTFGTGYNLTPKKETNNYIWLRPKVFWQLPFNSLALPHIAVQMGYSRTIKSK